MKIRILGTNLYVLPKKQTTSEIIQNLPPETTEIEIVTIKPLDSEVANFGLEAKMFPSDFRVGDEYEILVKKVTEPVVEDDGFLEY